MTAAAPPSPRAPHERAPRKAHGCLPPCTGRLRPRSTQNSPRSGRSKSTTPVQAKTGIEKRRVAVLSATLHRLPQPVLGFGTGLTRRFSQSRILRVRILLPGEANYASFRGPGDRRPGCRAELEDAGGARAPALCRRSLPGRGRGWHARRLARPPPLRTARRPPRRDRRSPTRLAPEAATCFSVQRRRDGEAEGEDGRPTPRPLAVSLSAAVGRRSGKRDVGCLSSIRRWSTNLRQPFAQASLNSWARAKAKETSPSGRHLAPAVCTTRRERRLVGVDVVAA